MSKISGKLGSQTSLRQSNRPRAVRGITGLPLFKKDQSKFSKFF